MPLSILVQLSEEFWKATLGNVRLPQSTSWGVNVILIIHLAGLDLEGLALVNDESLVGGTGRDSKDPRDGRRDR